MAFSTKLFSLDVPDDWHEQVVLTFLKDRRIINRLVYNYGDKPVPISEYSWKNGESEVFQCQAYFHSGDRIWTFTFTSDEAGYPGVRANIPDLISRFSPAGEQGV